MATGDTSGIRRTVLTERVVAITFLHPKFKLAVENAGRAATIAVQQAKAETDHLRLPNDKQHIIIEKILMNHYIPKYLGDPILASSLQPNAITPFEPRIFSFGKGKFAFKKFPLMILTPIAGPATITIAPMMPDQEAGPPVYDGKAIKIDWSLGCTIFAYGPFEIQVDGESRITVITIGYKKKDLEQNIQSNDDIRNSPLRPSSSTSNPEEPSPENPEAQSQQVRGAAASGEEAATPPHI